MKQKEIILVQDIREKSRYSKREVDDLVKDHYGVTIDEMFQLVQKMTTVNVMLLEQEAERRKKS